MPIKEIEIKNAKSIKYLKLSLSETNFLIGPNGVGKSNIFKILQYFYNNLTEKNIDNNIFDKKNPYCRYLEISLTFDFGDFFKKITNLIYNPKLDSQLSNFITKYFHFRDIYTIDDKCKLTFRQYRDNKVQWIINDNKENFFVEVFTYDKTDEEILYEFRSLLKNTFPFYCIEARHLNLTEWKDIWNIIGDISKMRTGKRNDLIESMKKFFSDPHHFGDKYTKIVDSIEKSFYENGIEINQYNNAELFSKIFKLQMNGEQFSYNHSKLDFHSDGINSFNYIRIFTTLLSNVSKFKLKEPVLLIDEPELGLYPKYIDEISNTFIQGSKYNQLMVITHSSRLLKNIMKSDLKCNVIHTISKKSYTQIKIIINLDNAKAKNLISERESSLYFSKGILFVEGETEYEVIHNKYLFELFPVLKEVDVAYGISNNSVFDAAHPSKRNTDIPFINLIDSDKILVYTNKSKFELKDDIRNPLKNCDKNKQKYLYGKRRVKTFEVKQRVEHIIKNQEFYFDDNWFFINYDLFNTFKQLIFNYCLEYNTFVLDTTIEGALVNRSTVDIFLDWFKSEVRAKESTSIDEIINHKDNIFYKVTVARLLVRGKYDNLKNIVSEKDYSNKIVDQNEKKIYNIIYKRGLLIDKGKKTEWMTGFLNFVFEKHIKVYKSPEEKIKAFQYLFPEMYLLIKKLEYMIKNR